MPQLGLLKIAHHPETLRIDNGDFCLSGCRIVAWAKRLALSERSLARLMLRETGLTFGRWRQQLHLIIALRELASGVSVQNVAANLGYESVNAFIIMFKKMMGSTPAHYFAARKTTDT